tara:strand:- start:1092 stop:1967 length:876 start_codon:yes stop_codon:yes gene_type:complete
MITFSELGKYGRLGNQLFQYAMLKSVSLETGHEIKIPDPSQIVYQNQPCLLNLFNISCDYLREEDKRNIRGTFMERDHTVFYPEVFRVADFVNFHGYFQSYRYFKDYQQEIREEFKLRGNLEEFGEDYVNSLKTNNEKVVSVHIRRGDNSDGTNPEYMNYYGEGDILTTDSSFGRYFYPALDTFKDENVKFLVFSGGSRSGMSHNQSDIEWCKSNLKGDNFVFCEGNTDIQDFAIMKSCDHHIASHMTSFGYWAAFLNDKEGKVVVAPSNYTVPDDGRVTRGFYPDKWKII